jgi:hypothetical protein
MNSPSRRGRSTLLRLPIAILGMTAAFAHANHHLWRISELYSNADGSVQFLEFYTGNGGEQFLASHSLVANNLGKITDYIFPNDLDGDSTGRRFLVATKGFAALNLVTPDFTVENGFFGIAGSWINFAGVDLFEYGPLPVDGRLSLDRDSGTFRPATPTNYAGDSVLLDLSIAPLNVQGLWWNSPANSESGWGVNLSQQDEKLFATWFTYDLDGAGLWLLMSDSVKGSGNSWTGTLHRTTGPPLATYSSANASTVAYQVVGSATFTFTDPRNGTFAYTVNGVTQTKLITLFTYGEPVPTCTVGGDPGAQVNYQDLWWRPGGTEAGWGVNLSHQGDTLFATWFTYAPDGRAMWLVGSSITKVSPGKYTGALFRTTGSPFSATPWLPRTVNTTVGSVTFTFTNANNGIMDYTVDGVTQSKPITRYLFGTPSVCR